ncbi:MFS transporter [Lolliginicoccus suaedae]|uniref:MFS transporter n=1 Tax=Lolliginicoccus suaedae TaxID=2605429 RepID=UPI0011EBE151|nr:nitrate/nitrite transporter [Lolliginicoccus suaedae]
MTLVSEKPTPGESAPSSASIKGGQWIDHWEPEDETFWEKTGKKTANRNLWFSVFAEHLGFNVWVLMSIVVVYLDQVGIAFSASQIFWLLIVPNLVGAALRVPYTFAIPKFGGRAFTTFSAGALLIPTSMLAYAVTTGAPYWFFLLTAALMGLGGGNFSSSMANISFFFPEKKKGLALGINAAGGNIGVAVSQLLVPFVISLGTGIDLIWAALIWMPFIIVGAIGSFFFMNSLTSAKPDKDSYKLALQNRQTWIMAFLYIGTFGSFIGYSFAFPTLIKLEFMDLGFGGWVRMAFLGALIGSVSRPFGGWLADRVGGAKITLLSFGGMAIGTLTALLAVSIANFWLFFAAFVALFILSGVSNGSAYRMIPLIFSAQTRAQVAELGGDLTEELKRSKRRAAAAVGVIGAAGAFGGVLVNLTFKQSVAIAGTLAPALIVITGFYLVCGLVTWWFYLRSSFAIERVPNLAYANV